MRNLITQIKFCSNIPYRWRVALNVMYSVKCARSAAPVIGCRGYHVTTTVSNCQSCWSSPWSFDHDCWTCVSSGKVSSSLYGVSPAERIDKIRLKNPVCNMTVTFSRFLLLRNPLCSAWPLWFKKYFIFLTKWKSVLTFLATFIYILLYISKLAKK